MNATPRGAVLSLAALALFGGCARNSSLSADAAPAVETAPVTPATVNAAAVQPATPPSSSASAEPAVIATASSAQPNASTTPPAPVVPAKRKATRPRSESDCKACNGAWATHGISKTPSCNCRTSDGGKRCRDGLECEGLCTAAETPERQVTQPGSPARGFWVGKCSEYVAVFGCYRPIDDGAGAKPVELTEPPQTICAD